MKRPGYCLLSVCLLVFLAPLKNEAMDNLWETRIYRANQAYQDGKYQDAVDGYTDLITEGFGNGHIYYNLGNAYVKNDQHGYAILHYEKARLLIPRDEDLNYNLSYCRRVIGANVFAGEHPIQDTFFWLNALTLPEVFWLFAGINAMFWPFLLLRMRYKKDWVYYLFIFMFACWLISAASFGLKWYQLITDNRAVVLPAQVNASAGPYSSDRVLFRIFSGATVLQERIEGGWALIRTADNRRGWVPTKHMEKVISETALKPIDASNS